MPTKRKTRSSVNDNTSLSSKKSKVEPEPEACVEKEGEVAEVICENSVAGSGSGSGSGVKVNKNRSSSKKPIDSVKKLPVRGEHDDDDEQEARFLGDPVPDGEARQRWPKRYEVKVFHTFTFATLSLFIYFFTVLVISTVCNLSL